MVGISYRYCKITETLRNSYAFYSFVYKCLQIKVINEIHKEVLLYLGMNDINYWFGLETIFGMTGKHPSKTGNIGWILRRTNEAVERFIKIGNNVTYDEHHGMLL